MYKSILLFLFTYSAALAQISITSNDLLGLLGNSGSVTEDTTGFVTVNVGSAGENQSWDFSSLNLQGFTTNHSFINPNQTPFGAQFTEANLAQQQTLAGDTSETFYGFFDITTDYITSLGFAFTGADSNFIEFEDNDQTALPLQYGNSWISVESDTFDLGNGFIINIDSTYTIIDGWGSVTVPAGTFNCLRLCDYNVYISIFQFDDFIDIDTVTTINYEWITKDNFIVANIESMEGETNPDFTMAEFASLLQDTETTTAIAVDLNTTPQEFILKQNYPNPFNPETLINYHLSINSEVELAVYNVLGEKVATLVSGQQQAGEHSVTFNAGSLASGIYFYSIKAGPYRAMKRMILLK